LHEVKQQPKEDVIGFYAPVISIIDELELLPAVDRHPAAAVMLAQIARMGWI
jgi:hypothetical protein